MRIHQSSTSSSRIDPSDGDENRREITPAPTSDSNRQQPAAGEEGGAASKGARLMLLIFPSHFQRSSNSSRRRHQLQPEARRDTARTSSNNCSGQQSGGTNSNINNSGETNKVARTPSAFYFLNPVYSTGKSGNKVKEGSVCSCTGSVPALDSIIPDDEDVLEEENIVKRQAMQGEVDSNVAVQLHGLAKIFAGTT
uniref:ABC transporter A family member 9 n=1 Tax=Solanum tuberosum TaxID=4113 RepID=M1C8M0_SOLTU